MYLHHAKITPGKQLVEKRTLRCEAHFSFRQRLQSVLRGAAKIQVVSSGENIDWNHSAKFEGPWTRTGRCRLELRFSARVRIGLGELIVEIWTLKMVAANTIWFRWIRPTGKIRIR